MKEEPTENIIAAIRRIHQGGFAASQKITDILMSTAAGEAANEVSTIDRSLWALAISSVSTRSRVVPE